MSQPAAHHDDHAQDPVDTVVEVAHWVLPLAGGVLIFLLAFIAVFMA